MTSPDADQHRVTLSKDGRVVIPVEVRRQLELHPGQELVLRVSGDRLTLLPAPSAELERRIWGELDLPVWLRSA